MAGEKTLGNHGLAYLLTKGTEIEGAAGKAEKGKWYYVKSLPTTGDATVPVRPGLPFLASKEITLAAGESIIPLTLDMLGMARDKSLSASKNVVDATTDSSNGIAESLSDGIVTTTGSISGYNMIPESGGAQEKIIQQFQTYLRDTAGTVTTSEVSTEPMLLMIDWTARRTKVTGYVAGDPMEIDILPVIFTSKATDGAYGSTKSFNVDFTATGRDDDGCEPAHWVGAYVAPSAE